MDTTDKPIPLDEIQKHSTEENGWIVLDGNVYDVSSYDHPGGKDVFKEFFGGQADAKEEFEDQGHSRSAYKQLSTLKIGVLKGEIKVKEKSRDSDSDTVTKAVIVAMFLILVYGLKNFIMSS